jgi:hypothetical protein
LSLHTQVQRGRRLIKKDEPGSKGQCPGDGSALSLPAAQFVRKPLTQRRVESNLDQQTLDARTLTGQSLRLCDRILDPPPWVKARIGILPDHPDLGRLTPRDSSDCPAIDPYFSRSKRLKPKHDPGQCRFATTGLADDSQRLAGLDPKADAVQRPRPSKFDDRVLDF